MSGLSQAVERAFADAWQDSFYDDYGNVPMPVDNWMRDNVDRTKNIGEFLSNVRFLELNFWGDLADLRGYMRGRLGIQVYHLSLMRWRGCTTETRSGVGRIAETICVNLSMMSIFELSHFSPLFFSLLKLYSLSLLGISVIVQKRLFDLLVVAHDFDAWGVSNRFEYVVIAVEALLSNARSGFPNFRARVLLITFDVVADDSLYEVLFLCFRLCSAY